MDMIQKERREYVTPDSDSIVLNPRSSIMETSPGTPGGGESEDPESGNGY